LLDPGHSPHSTSRPSISSTAATRSAGAGSLSAVLATTTRRLRASTSSRSARRARSSLPMQSSTAAPGWRISVNQNVPARKQHRNVLDHRKQFRGRGRSSARNCQSAIAEGGPELLLAIVIAIAIVRLVINPCRREGGLPGGLRGARNQ
jgi:hypothetical protein